MGHVRLGHWPKSRKWNEVVNFIASGMAAAKVAAAVLKAAEQAFNRIGYDVGYEKASWFLIQLSEAAAQKSPLDYLRTQGIDIKEASLVGIATALTNAMDDSNRSNKHLSTESEIARNALVVAVTSTVAAAMSQQTFFDGENNYAEEAVKKLGSPKAFASMFQKYLTDFMDRGLKYYLDKQLSAHLGEDKRFRTLEEQQQFRKEIEQHCHECSVVLPKYAEEWVAKHRYHEEEGINEKNVKGFSVFGLQKLVKMLRLEKEEFDAR